MLLGGSTILANLHSHHNPKPNLLKLLVRDLGYLETNGIITCGSTPRQRLGLVLNAVRLWKELCSSSRRFDDFNSKTGDSPLHLLTKIGSRVQLKIQPGSVLGLISDCTCQEFMAFASNPELTMLYS